MVRDPDVGFSEGFHGFGDDPVFQDDPDAGKPARACLVPPRLPERTPEIAQEQRREADRYAADETLPPDSGGDSAARPHAAAGGGRPSTRRAT